MAKQSFTLSRDVRVRGKVCKAGDKISLDNDDPTDASTIGHLLSSNALVEESAAKILTTPIVEPAKEPEEKPEPKTSKQSKG